MRCAHNLDHDFSLDSSPRRLATCTHRFFSAGNAQREREWSALGRSAYGQRMSSEVCDARRAKVVFGSDAQLIGHLQVDEDGLEEDAERDLRAAG